MREHLDMSLRGKYPVHPYRKPACHHQLGHGKVFLVIPHLGAWYPYARKSSLHQQLQNMSCVPFVRLLFPYIAGTNLRCLANPHFLFELL